MHVGGHLRDPFCKAWEEELEEEWFMAFPSKIDALQHLGKLWNCTDGVPADVRQAAVDFLDDEGALDEYESRRLLLGCSYAMLVRRLIPWLREEAAWS